MRRLYLQIYATVILVLAIAALGWNALSAARMGPHEMRMLGGVARLVDQLIPGPERPLPEQHAALERIADAMLSEASIYGADGQLITAVGEPIPFPAADTTESSTWHLGAGVRPPGAPRVVRERGSFRIQFQLADGRWLLLRHPFVYGPLFELGSGLALLAVAVAVGAYPLIRRLTRRLERLQQRVDALGSGDLAARVEVEGRDEVADLARSFNRAASRIGQLVAAQRTLLASASHELRSPLARIRMALELAVDDARPALRAGIERDIGELDDLIGELLLASRLDAEPTLERVETVDLLALVAEEAARTGAKVSGEPAPLAGEPRMLRWLARNLLENAHRHGDGSPVESSIARMAPRGARLRVEDRGPGVPEEERERIFEPFYRPPGSRETGSGVGLGLALVRRIARHHGGDARCLARPGGGTCFEVELPGAAV